MKIICEHGRADGSCSTCDQVQQPGPARPQQAHEQARHFICNVVGCKVAKSHAHVRDLGELVQVGASLAGRKMDRRQAKLAGGILNFLLGGL